MAADGKRYRITGPAIVTLADQTSSTSYSTNSTLPLCWANLPAGSYNISAKVAGYKPMLPTSVTVRPPTTTDAALRFDPIPSHVRFIVSPTNASPSIFSGTRLLGHAPGPIELEPFVEHSLVFRASGWRDLQQKVSLPKPSKSFRCNIAMERIQAGLRVSVQTSEREPPTKGSLRINSSRPITIDIPFETQRIPYKGSAIVQLEVKGYTGVSSQEVMFVDREMVEVVFPIRKPSWAKRTLDSISGVFGSEEDR